MLSGHNAYWMWGAGRASDQTVLVVDALGWLRAYFASCRLLTIYHAPYQVQNDWTPIQIGVCTGPSASWHKLWPPAEALPVTRAPRAAPQKMPFSAPPTNRTAETVLVQIGGSRSR